MNKNILNLILNILSVKKEETMKKSSGIGLMVFLMSFALAISAYGADRLLVQDPGGNTKFVVTDDGSMALNASSPEGRFTIVDNITTFNRGLSVSQNTSDTAGGKINFQKSRGTQTSPLAVQNGDYSAVFGFRNYTLAGSYIQNSVFGVRVNGTVTSTSVPIDFFISTSATNDQDAFLNGTVRLLINSIGNVGIGTTNPSYPLHMASGARCTTGGVWTDASSREYKENIMELSADQALLAFNKLNPVTFNYKVDAAEKHVGFIAEDVPELVATPDKKALSPMDIVALLTKVVQEQQKTIAALNEKVTRLEQQVK